MSGPSIHQPTRSDMDLEVDRLWRCMTQTDDPELKVIYGRRFTAAVNRRNAARSPEEVAELEREKGLRA